MKDAIRTLGALAAAGAALGTASGFLGATWWVLDLFANFRLQYFYALVVAAGILGGLDRPRLALAATLAAAVNLGCIAPLYMPGGPEPRAGAPRLELVSFNVRGNNSRRAEIAAAIAERDPDVAILSEVRPEMADALGELSGYQLVLEPRIDNFGMALLIRDDVVTLAGGTVHFGRGAFPGVTATVVLGDRPVSILGLHAPPPVRARMAAERDRTIREAARWARAQTGAVIVAGDLNATPWSHAFDWLTDGAGLVDSSLGHGIQPTWPLGLPIVSIPIDHCLHSKDLAVVRRETGPRLGSDHAPLLVTLTWARR